MNSVNVFIVFNVFIICITRAAQISATPDLKAILNKDISIEYTSDETLAQNRYARHVELEQPSMNNLFDKRNSGLSWYEKQQKKNFISKVFQKLSEKIKEEAGQESPESIKASNSKSTATNEENTKHPLAMKHVQNVLLKMIRRWKKRNGMVPGKLSYG